MSEIIKDPTPVQVQAAKDFLWAYLAQRNQELLILMANTDSLNENGLETKEITIFFTYNQPQGHEKKISG